jgi:hypothetical protein
VVPLSRRRKTKRKPRTTTSYLRCRSGGRLSRIKLVNVRPILCLLIPSLKGLVWGKKADRSSLRFLSYLLLFLSSALRVRSVSAVPDEEATRIHRNDVIYVNAGEVILGPDASSSSSSTPSKKGRKGKGKEKKRQKKESAKGEVWLAKILDISVYIFSFVDKRVASVGSDRKALDD